MRAAIYAIRPRLHTIVRSPFGDDVVLCGTTVYEPEELVQPTGLLDAQGRELVRVRERGPIGFVLGRDRDNGR